MKLAERINVTLEKANFGQLVGTEVTYVQIRKMANRILKPFGGKAKLFKDKGMTLSQKKFGFTVSGSYQPGSKDAIVQIHQPTNRTKITLTPRSADRLQFLVIQTLHHELIHKGQFAYDFDGDVVTVPFNLPRRASPTRQEDMLYFSQRYEVEAYANSLAHEILYYYPNESPTSVINRIDKCRKLSVYRSYQKAFKGTDWQKVRKELLRQTWRWIPEIVLPKRVLTNA